MKRYFTACCAWSYPSVRRVRINCELVRNTSIHLYQLCVHRYQYDPVAVWHLVWVLHEVPMGLNARQVTRSHHLMRSSDHLLAHHEHMPSARYLSHLRRSSTHTLRADRTWDAKHDLQIRIKSCDWSEVCEKYWYEKMNKKLIIFCVILVKSHIPNQ